jgi:hypothetical protein
MNARVRENTRKLLQSEGVSKAAESHPAVRSMSDVAMRSLGAAELEGASTSAVRDADRKAAGAIYGMASHLLLVSRDSKLVGSLGDAAHALSGYAKQSGKAQAPAIAEE